MAHGCVLSLPSVLSGVSSPGQPRGPHTFPSYLALVFQLDHDVVSYDRHFSSLERGQRLDVTEHQLSWTSLRLCKSVFIMVGLQETGKRLRKCQRLCCSPLSHLRERCILLPMLPWAR